MSKAKEIYKALSAEFPPDALSKDNSRGFDLTSIKAQYIVERLNEVLGVDNWCLLGKYTEVTGGILFLGTLKITIDGKEVVRESSGFSQHKKNVGDTYKSARTDALSKAASYIGVGNSVFKGLVKPPGSGSASRVEAPPKGKFSKPVVDEDDEF